MRIISFDIGETNLAYATIDLDYDSKEKFAKLNTLKLIDFQLIDLMYPNSKVCDSILKSGKNSGKKCGQRCYRLESKCRKHLGIKSVPKTRYLNKRKTCVNIIAELDKLINGYTNIDAIVIEQQFTRNRRMIEISHYLYMYLVSKILNTKIKITYLTAKRRMEYFCNLFKDECGVDGIIFKNNVKKYNRKCNAISLTKYLIKTYSDDETIKLFDDLRKKDDVSDCLIQGLWYITKNYKLRKDV